MRRLWSLLLVVLLVACSSPAPQASAPASGGVPAALIVGVEGETALKRQGWRDYAPAMLGTVLRRGDLVRAATSGKAVVACSDLSLSELSGGVKGYPCRTEGPAPIAYQGGLVNATRGDPNADYPLVLSPRKSKILNDRPLLRWEAYGGASSYKVSIQGTGWQTEVGTTELQYPANAPALVPGQGYRLIVEADGRSSAEEAGPGLGFSLLPIAEAEQVRADEARARALGLGDEATRLLVANLYAGHQMYAEALGVLNDGAAPSQPALARLTGDLYLTVGLVRRAEEAYIAALGLSTAAGDREGQALTERGLATVYRLLGNAQEADGHFGSARALFDTLGDRQAVGEIDQALK